MKDIAAESGEPEKVNDVTINAMMVVGLVVGLAFFILVPIIFSRMLNRHIHVRWELTAAEGLVKIGLFVGYVVAISFLKDIRRVFQYHGAEHKTINAYEAGVDLSVENVTPYSKVHVRCGTSFILVVLVANIVIYALVGDHLPHGSLLEKGFINNLIRWGYHLALLPFVAGLSYEVIRFAGNCKDSILTKVMLYARPADAEDHDPRARAGDDRGRDQIAAGRAPKGECGMRNGDRGVRQAVT